MNAFTHCETDLICEFWKWSKPHKMGSVVDIFFVLDSDLRWFWRGQHSANASANFPASKSSTSDLLWLKAVTTFLCAVFINLQAHVILPVAASDFCAWACVTLGLGSKSGNAHVNRSLQLIVYNGLIIQHKTHWQIERAILDNGIPGQRVPCKIQMLKKS